MKGVRLITSGDYGGSVEPMEEALRLYMHEYQMCQVDCEGVAHVSPDKDLYTVLAGVYAYNTGCSHGTQGHQMLNNLISFTQTSVLTS